ncbi:MAG: hypothetical protein ACJASF_002349 [Vicingaceae bacterium]|jgi:hypothetical protein
MKNFSILFFSFLFANLSFAQTGPGGVGNSSNMDAWMDAARVTGLTNNDPMSSWSDFSGNSNTAIQAITANQPIFLTNQINGLPAINFDGVDDFFDFSTNITAGPITIFTVHLSTRISLGSILSTEKHILWTENNRVSSLYVSPTTRYKIAKVNNAFSVFSLQTDGSVSGSSLDLFDGNTSSNFTRTSLSSRATSVIGNYNNTLYLQGQMAEIIIFNEELVSAKRKIVSNYLAAKYDMTAEQNLYAYQTNHNQVMGVGQEADGSQTVARGLDSLEISNPSSLGNGDYILVGNDGAGFGTDAINIPGSVLQRWNQVWRVDKTGTPGNIDLEFFLGTNNFAAPSAYVLLVENVDGNFGNGGTFLDPSTPSYDAVNNSITFSNINLVDGSYFTLAETSGDITATANGNWSSTGTWSCGCIPGIGDLVIIESPFNVIVDVNSSAGNLTIENGASLTFSGNDTLFTDGNVIVQASTAFNSGTVAAIGTASNQSLTNSSGLPIALNNLFSSNPNGLDIITGDWSLSGSLQITAGGMDVSGANSFTLTSDATSTSQILPSMSNAFTGNFTVQRYISPRNANYANLSSPVQSATIADWDDDIYMSGVSGLNGNATFGPGGPIYYSVYSYNRLLDKHDTITSTATALVPGKGFEVWLADNATTFNGRTIDVVGTPNSGNSTTALVNQGWNLVGNPYHSFIEYDSIRTSAWVPNNYYIFNTDAGSYSFFDETNKPPIAPSQGFWIFKISGGTKAVDFKESGKANSTSSAFLRRKKIKNFELKISNNQNLFTHKAAFNFDLNSTNGIDEKDAYYLVSPEKKAPAIYSKALNSEEGLILNSINPFDEIQKIPIDVYAGEDGIFSIQAENIEEVYGNYSCVYLKDNTTGNAIDLSVDPEYTFFANEGTTQRFNLILSNEFNSCQDLIKNGNLVQKLEHNLDLRNTFGTWNLDYTLDENLNQIEIRVYNMNGQLVLSPISFTTSGGGSRVLNELNQLEGIYLIQINTKDGVLNKKIKL